MRRNRFLVLIAAGLVCLSVFAYLGVVKKRNAAKAPEQRTVIGIYTGDGAHPSLQEVARRMFAWMGFDTVSLNARDINKGRFKNADLVYFPGGSTPSYRRDISETGRGNLRAFVRNGGGYIGTCAGALIACERNIWQGRDDNNGLFGLVPATGVGPISEIDDGDGICMVDLAVDKGTEIGAKHPEPVYVLSINSPYFEVGESEPIAVVAEYDAIKKPAYIAYRYGQGRVFLTGPHPEIEEDSERDGDDYFDSFEDRGSDWPFMKSAAEWCLRRS